MLLRVIDYDHQTPKNLARGLINFSTTSLIRDDLSIILQTISGPIKVGLAALGTQGSLVGCLLLFLGGLLHWIGAQPIVWLSTNNLVFPFALLIAFWLGFVLRLIPASRYELRDTQASSILGIQIFAALGLGFTISKLLGRLEPLLIFYSAISLGLGFTLACDFITLSLPRAYKYREPPL